MKVLGQIVLCFLFWQGSSCGLKQPLYLERMESLALCMDKVDDALLQYEQRNRNEKIVLICGECNRELCIDDILLSLGVQAVNSALREADNFDVLKKLLENTEKIFLQGTMEQVMMLILSMSKAMSVTCSKCKSSTWQAEIRKNIKQIELAN